MIVQYYKMPDGEPTTNVKSLLPNVISPQNLPDGILNALGVARVVATQPKLEWWQQRGGRIIDTSVTPHEMTWGVESRPEAEIRQSVASRANGSKLNDAVEAVALARLLAGDDTPVAVFEHGEFVARTPADVLAEARSLAEDDYLEAVAMLAASFSAEDGSVAIGTVIENDTLKDWEPPQGAHDALPLGAIRRHLGDVWLSLLDNNVWEPGQAGWRNISTPQAGQYEPWSPPSGADGNKYMISSRVTHSDKNWESLINNNVWEPGAPGSEALWKEID